MGKEEATGLALGIAKLMRMNSPEGSQLTPATKSQPLKFEGKTKVNSAVEQSSICNQKAKRSLSTSSYLSCVLCRKKCDTNLDLVRHFFLHKTQERYEDVDNDLLAF
jgi:hypothetical protein